MKLRVLYVWKMGPVLLAVFAFTTLIGLGSAIQDNPKKSKTLSGKDTVFLLRELRAPDYYHAVYIEKNRKSKFYTWLLDFKLSKGDDENLKASIGYMKDTKQLKVKRFALGELPREWVPVYQYKDTFYLYGPSDWGNAGKQILSDSLLVSWYMDGPSPLSIQSFRKESANRFTITGYDPYPDLKPDSARSGMELTIIMIDWKKKLAVWRYKRSGNDTYSYELYVDREHAKDLDMVVNYCRTMKQMEFRFDSPDFEKILSRIP